MKSTCGNEVILERAGGSFTFEIAVKADKQQGWQSPKKTAKASTQNMDSDETANEKSYCDAVRGEECKEMVGTPCEERFPQTSDGSPQHRNNQKEGPVCTDVMHLQMVVWSTRQASRRRWRRADQSRARSWSSSL